MGGLTVFKLGLELADKIKGVILFAPAIKLAQPKVLLKVAHFLGSIMPTWRVIYRKKGLVTKNP